jgi:hypothetical protein
LENLTIKIKKDLGGIKIIVTALPTSAFASGSLKNFASINFAIGEANVSAGASSTWTTVKTIKHSWTSSNGAKSADYQGNILIGSKCDYRAGSIQLVNKVELKLLGYPKPYIVHAGVS